MRVIGISKISKKEQERSVGSWLASEVTCESLALSFKACGSGGTVLYGLRKIFPLLGSWSFSLFFGYIAMLRYRPPCAVNYMLMLLSDSLPQWWWLSVSEIHQRVIISEAKASNVQASNLPLKISACSWKHKTSNDLLLCMLEGWKHFWNLVSSWTMWSCLKPTGQY